MLLGRSIARSLLKLGLKPVVRLFRPRTFSSKYILKTEKLRIEESRKVRLPDARAAGQWSGLGLSGGGIRSASLALGVLQAFAEHDLLRRFDYISSVSGGGYLAGSLQWWWTAHPREDSGGQQTQFGLGKSDFPYGPARISTAKEDVTVIRGRQNLEYLRSHSAYLTPGNGLTSWSMLAVLIRTTAISLFTWIPLLAVLFAILLVVDHDWLQNWASQRELWSPLGGIIPARWQDACHGIECEFRYRTIYALGLYLYYVIVAIFVVASIVFAFMSRSPQGNGISWPVYSLVALSTLAAALIFAAIKRFGFDQLDASLTIAITIGILFIIVASTTVFSELFTTASLNASYILRRSLEVILGKALVPSIIFFATATIPLVPYFVVTHDFGSGEVIGVAISLLSGIGSAAYGYYTFLRNTLPSLSGQILASLGSALYLYATLVIGYSLSIMWARSDIYDDWGANVAIGLTGCFIIALALSIFANINYVGLHRFYRDRLMEAFMPTDHAVLCGISTYSPVADNLLVTELRSNVEKGTIAPVPYPLINTNVIMVNDADRKVATRGGDNFVISPLFVGSSVTGWQDSASYINHNGPLTLASSVAASGAAATASAGYIGTGITMNPLVAAVMSLLNIRLGLWVSNPARRWPVPFPTIPTFLHPGLISGVFSMRHSRKSRFIELTDGGHFENLGLYELVRRKLPTIVVVDGEADPAISLSSLVSATRRIEQDFNATLSFDSTFGKGPERLMMYEQKGYPSGLKYAQSPFVVARISYDDGTKGTLVYIKSTLIKEMDFTTAGYLAANPSFPHQSTVDQFFDQDQFDAYRYLGYDTALNVIRDLQLPQCMGDAEQIWTNYLGIKASTTVPGQNESPS